jgi:predicted nuclease of predicted toxin-antitoxin system
MLEMPDQATPAATLGIRHQLAMADALIYATARHQSATLWTQDADFKDLPHVRYFSENSILMPVASLLLPPIAGRRCVAKA